MELHEAMYSLRAMRRLKTDAVPEELIWKVLDAAIRAASGGNRQPWNFIVVTDREKKQKIAAWYLDGWNAVYGQVQQAASADGAAARTYRSAEYLANHLAEAPVFIIPTVNATGVAAVSGMGSSIFPAVQNLMLAARALGLGTVLTTLHRRHKERVHEILGIPDGVESAAIVPLGWPNRDYAPNRRPPLEQFVAHDRWDG